jgi:hypothetical protein
LTDENIQLTTSLNEVREQLESAAREQSEHDSQRQAENDELREQLDAVLKDRAAKEVQSQQEFENWRRQLEEAHQHAATLAESTAAWERELATRQQASSEAESMLADAQRQLADQTQKLDESAEAARQLQLELAAAQASQTALEMECDEWRRRSLAAEHEQAELSQRVAKLQSQMEGLKVSPPVIEAPEWPAAPSAGVSAVDQSTEVERGIETAGHDEVPVETLAVADEPFAWAVTAESAEGRDEDFISWEAKPAPHDSPAIGDAMLRELYDAQQREMIPPSESWSGTADECAAALTVEPTETVDFWNEKREPKREDFIPPALIEPAAALPREASQAPSTGRDDQPTSFIERYSHLFPDDHQSPPPAAALPESPSIGSPLLQSTAPTLPSAAAAPPSDADEESIEQYMSKLLQRVRGPSGGPAETQARPAASPHMLPIGQRTTLTEQSAAVVPPTVTTPKFSWATALEGYRQTSSAPAPQTDLEALRALANETARRAISRHALRKHRRNALTKVIVSTLAGVTSLWLMLESDSWRTLQFNTACVALLVAAYWAGQTYRALLQSLREKPIEDSEEESQSLAAAPHSPLPIDVEKPAGKSIESA